MKTLIINFLLVSLPYSLAVVQMNQVEQPVNKVKQKLKRYGKNLQLKHLEIQ